MYCKPCELVIQAFAKHWRREGMDLAWSKPRLVSLRKRKPELCSQCPTKPTYKAGLCKACYSKHRRQLATGQCIDCRKFHPLTKKGLCRTCNRRYKALHFIRS